MKLAQNLTIKIKLRQLLGGEVLQIPSQGSTPWTMQGDVSRIRSTVVRPTHAQC